jgi:hypothetical protein
MSDIELTLDFDWTESRLCLQKRRFSHPSLQKILSGDVLGPGTNIRWNAGVRNLCGAFVHVKRRSLQSGDTVLFDGEVGERLYDSFKPSKALSTDWVRDFFGTCRERKQKRPKRKKRKCRNAMRARPFGDRLRGGPGQTAEDVEVSLLSKILCAKRNQVIVSSELLPYQKLTIKVNGADVADGERLGLLHEALGYERNDSRIAELFCRFRAARQTAAPIDESPPRPPSDVGGDHGFPPTYRLSFSGANSYNFAKLGLLLLKFVDRPSIILDVRGVDRLASEAEQEAIRLNGGVIGGVFHGASINGYERTLTLRRSQNVLMTVGGPNATSERIVAETVSFDLEGDFAEELFALAPEMRFHINDRRHLSDEWSGPDRVSWLTALAQRKPTCETAEGLLGLLGETMPAERRHQVIQAFRSLDELCRVRKSLARKLTTALCGALTKSEKSSVDPLSIVYLPEAIASVAKSHEETRLKAVDDLLRTAANERWLRKHSDIAWSVVVALNNIGPTNDQQIAQLVRLKQMLTGVPQEKRIETIVAEGIERILTGYHRPPVGEGAGPAARGP